jgi:hypothetical protein
MVVKRPESSALVALRGVVGSGVVGGGFDFSSDRSVDGAPVAAGGAGENWSGRCLGGGLVVVTTTVRGCGEEWGVVLADVKIRLGFVVWADEDVKVVVVANPALVAQGCS